MPFLRLGEKLFSAPPMGLTPGQIVTMMRADLGQAFAALWSATLHALVVWLGVGVVMVLLLYPLLTMVLREAVRKMRAGTVRMAQ